MSEKKYKKTTYKKRGWARKKAVAFVTAPPVTTGAKNTLAAAAREMNKQKKSFFETAVKGKMEDILPKAYKEHSKLIASALETTITDTTVGIIDHMRSGVVNRGADKYGFFEKQSLPPSNVDSAVQAASTKVRTKFVTGQPSTNSVTKMAEIFGSSSFEVFNTEKNFKEGRSLALTGNFGFNQKRYTFLGSTFTPNVYDYKEIFGMDDYSFPKFDDQTAYGLAQEEHVNFKITNLNKFLPMNFNIHLVEFRDRELTNLDLCNITFSNNLSKESVSGRVPEKYQFENFEQVTVGGTTYQKSVMASKNCRLEMSPAFRQNSKVAKTLKRKLEPGMIWHVDLIFHLGAGICLDQLFYDSLQLAGKSESQPSTYGIIFECIGTDTTLVEAHKGTKQEHIGTSAGAFCFECRKSYKVVNSDINLSKSGFESSKAAIKLYRRDISLDKPFNVPFDKISEVETVDGFYTPVRSSIDIKESGEI